MNACDGDGDMRKDGKMLRFPTVKEVRLVAHANLSDPAGVIDVELGFGRGSRGPGRGFDHGEYVAAVRQVGLSLVAYAESYGAAAAAHGDL